MSVAPRYLPLLSTPALDRALHAPEPATDVVAWGLPRGRGVLPTASGGDALVLALRAIADHGRVVVAAYTCGRVAGAIRAAGWTPRWVDVDPRTFEMDAGELARVVAQEPVAAVIVTHFFGVMADAAGIARMLAGRGIALVEDCALAQGAARDGREAGSVGDFAVFSFGRGKPLDLGVGGALVADILPHVATRAGIDGNAFARRAWRASRGPWGVRYRIVDALRQLLRVRAATAGARALAFDATPLAPSAEAALRRMLCAVDAPAVLARRRTRAQRIAVALAAAPATGWRTVAMPHAAVACPAAFPLLCADRDAVLRRLRRAGIDCPSFFDYVAGTLDGAGRFAGAEEVARCIVQLPLHDAVPDAVLDRALRAL